MPSEFVHAVTKHNLVTWYLLPLIHLNKFSFGSGNFLESYITSTGTTLIVKMVSLHIIPTDYDYRRHYLFLDAAEGEGQDPSAICYRFPEKWLPDFELFKAGKFSKFSELAKNRIMEYSGLIHGERDQDGIPVNDARILALTRDKVLIRIWEEELGLPRGHLEGQELLDIPPPNNYLDLT